jgi:glycosyltransferase involved in cell wall biosynthesis
MHISMHTILSSEESEFGVGARGLTHETDIRKVMTKISPAHGFGYAAKCIIESLLELGHEVSYFDPAAPIGLSFGHPDHWDWHPGQYRLGYMAWESSELKPHWHSKLELADEIWCTNDYVRDILIENGYGHKKLYVYEHGIEHIWTPRLRKPGSKLKFLHVDSNAARKGGDMLVRSFRRVFGDSEDVQLTLKTNGPLELRVKNRSGSIVGNPDQLYNNVTCVSEKLPIESLIHMFHRHNALIYPSCLSEDTEILTAEGFKSVNEVSVGDMIAGIDDRERLSYAPALEKFDYEYSGRMIEVSNTSHSVRVTENHSMLIRGQTGKLRRINAGELPELGNSRWYLPVVHAGNDAPDPEKLSVESIAGSKTESVNHWRLKKLTGFVDTELFFEFMGWYISEGSTYSCNNGEYVTQIAQRPDINRKKYERIMYVAEELGLNPVRDRASIKISGKQLLQIVSECGRYAENKRIPRWMLGYGPKALRALYNGMMLGDGTRSGHNVSYYTSSPGLRDDFQELCFLLGYRTNVFERPPATRYVESWGRDISSRFINYQIGVAEIKTSGTFRKADVSESESTERVWCVRTDLSTIVTRRNGKITVMGNCAEGFGLIPLQAMATGMPTVCTEEWASYRELLLPELRLGSIMGESPWQHIHPGRVPWPDEQQLDMLLEYVADSYDTLSRQAFELAPEVHRRYDWLKLTEKAFAQIPYNA